ncbi:DUF418 domain-containing protein [Oceanobacillus sp. CAU 1775]
MENGRAPIKEKNRIVWIDIIRGFAILGIFVVNIGAFSAPYFMYGGSEAAWPAPVDQFMLFFIDVFFQGSFYTLFSILFGFSWQMMKDRLVIRDKNIVPFLFRRQLALVGIGLAHAFLIWHGDILLSYGLVGMLLLLFIEVKDRNLLIWAIILLGGSVAFISFGLYQVRFIIGGADYQMINRAVENYSSFNPIRILGQNAHDWSMMNSGIAFIFLIVILLPLFLFGAYIARKGWLHKPAEHQDLLWRILQISFFVFIFLKIGPYVFDNPLWFSYIQDNIGGTASAVFYIVLLTIISQYRIGLKILGPLKYVGRMALSNYILQSIFCFILFYGFGLYHRVSPTLSLLIVILFFVLQIVLSKKWLEKYHFGPLEWVLRSLSYKKKQSFRREPREEQKL